MSEVVQYYLDREKEYNFNNQKKYKNDNEDLKFLSIEKIGGMTVDENGKNKSNIKIRANLEEIKERMKTEENKDTFLTDKINLNSNYKEERGGDINSLNFENKSIIKVEKGETVPIDFEKLVINLKDKTDQPKPINPLFFIINGEKPLEKEKLLNYNTNPQFFPTTIPYKDKINNIKSNNIDKGKFSYMKQLEEEHDILHKINIYNKTHHDFLKNYNFKNCFNKPTDDKIKIISDVKKLIFHSKTNNIEDNAKIIKQIERSEMMNRSLGHGIFKYRNKFEKERKNLWEKKKKEFIEDQIEKGKMNINLKKPNLFEENKIYDRASQVFFTRTYMKMTYEDYKKIQEEKKNYKKLNDELNMKIERLYKKKEPIPFSDIKKIMRDQNMDNVFRRAQTEIMKPTKEELIEYSKELSSNTSNLHN
jgi:hypothetical protein